MCTSRSSAPSSSSSLTCVCLHLLELAELALGILDLTENCWEPAQGDFAGSARKKSWSRLLRGSLSVDFCVSSPASNSVAFCKPHITLSLCMTCRCSLVLTSVKWATGPGGHSICTFGAWRDWRLCMAHHCRPAGHQGGFHADLSSLRRHSAALPQCKSSILMCLLATWHCVFPQMP